MLENMLFTIFRSSESSECFSVSLKHSLDSLDFFCQKIIFQIFYGKIVSKIRIIYVIFHIVKFFYLKLKFSVVKSNYGFFHFSTKTKDGIRWDDRKYHATLMIENSSISSTPSYYLWQKQLCRI